MSKTETILLQLTGRALFDAPTDFDPAGSDWTALYQEAAGQAVPLLIWDILTDEERALVPETTASRWEQDSFHLIMHNERILYEQEQVIRLLEDAGIPCVILKGSSSAACYPRPALRVMGDIDLLTDPGQQMKAVKLLQANGYGDVLDDTHHCHMTISKGNVRVEIHKEPNGLFLNENAESVKKIRSFFCDAVERRQFVEGMPFPSDDQQAVILLLHKLEHFMTSGLGLRQMCDWAVFADRKLDATDPEGRALLEDLIPLLSDFGLLTFAGVMTRACVEYLGLPQEKVPWAMQYEKDTAAKVIGQILKDGNFGQKTDKYGERLFTDPHSSNRMTSLVRVLGSACREHWPPCREHAALMPVAPFVLLGRYIVQRRRGERHKLDLIRKYRQAGPEQRLYKELKPFVVEQKR
ncbi:MAG: nucleotidyltransferase family protein [Lachnospiraceae bacterium]|nr:nucleotidyltransferase family protein [Lachnospiraceae bacterium]